MITIVKGFLIGIANIIPGVSGGTFALVLGIFDRLIRALKGLDASATRSCLNLVLRGFSAAARQDFRRAWKRMDGTFLMLLGLGAVVALFSCAFVFDYLLKVHPSETLAFFIGLILPSLSVPWKMMEKRGWLQLAWILPGMALTVGLSLMEFSGSARPGYPLVFIGGVLAVSAMVLPGVSGSFLLLVLGLYQPVLTNIKALTKALSGSLESSTLAFLGVLGLGVVVGLVAFSHVMSLLLSRFRSATLAFLIGLILGSFWVLWPIKDKDFESGRSVYGSKGEIKQDIAVATAPNRLPGGEPGDGGLCLWCALTLGVGLVGAMGINRLGRSE